MCSGCNEKKVFSNGLCKTCYHREYYRANREKRCEYNKNPRRRFSRAVSSSERYDKEWKLTLEQYEALISQPCYYCLKPVGGVGIGLDRIDNNNRTYEIGNVVSCCHYCNTVKNDNKSLVETVDQIRYGNASETISYFIKRPRRSRKSFAIVQRTTTNGVVSYQTMKSAEIDAVNDSQLPEEQKEEMIRAILESFKLQSLGIA